MIRLLPLVIAALLLPLNAAADTFKIATLAPDGTTWMQELRNGAAEIERRSAGRVKFKFYPGGVMGNDQSVLRKIRIGQLHGGAITGGGLADIYPDAQVYNLPLVFQSYAEVDYVRERMDKLLLDGLRQHGFVGFGLGEGGFAYLMSSQPVARADDLKGHKVWVPDGDDFSRAAFQAVNIAPIALPLTDVLTALQTGMIDTIASSTMGAIALHWHTRVKYLTDTPLMYLYGTLIIQRQAFERLSATDQALVDEVMGDTFRRLNQQNRLDNDQARAALQKQGIRFIATTPEDRQRWQRAVDTAVNQLIQRGMISREIVQTLNRHLADFRRGKS